MRCVWKDDNNQEHALYYDRDTEFLRFSQKYRLWIALLKDIGASSSADIVQIKPQSATARGARGIDVTSTPRICEGYHDHLGCPEVGVDNGVKYYVYKQNGGKLKIYPDSEYLRWSIPDNEYIAANSLTDQ